MGKQVTPAIAIIAFRQYGGNFIGLYGVKLCVYKYRCLIFRARIIAGFGIFQVEMSTKIFQAALNGVLGCLKYSMKA